MAGSSANSWAPAVAPNGAGAAGDGEDADCGAKVRPHERRTPTRPRKRVRSCGLSRSGLSYSHAVCSLREGRKGRGGGRGSEEERPGPYVCVGQELPKPNCITLNLEQGNERTATSGLMVSLRSTRTPCTQESDTLLTHSGRIFHNVIFAREQKKTTQYWTGGRLTGLSVGAKISIRWDSMSNTNACKQTRHK